MRIGTIVYGPLWTPTSCARRIGEMSARTVEGQALDVGWVRDHVYDLSPADYLDMALGKTGYYSGIAPLRVGALIGKGTAHQIEALQEFGRNSSIAFQIQDDLLNILGDVDTMGKDYLTDVLESKPPSWSSIASRSPNRPTGPQRCCALAHRRASGDRGIGGHLTIAGHSNTPENGPSLILKARLCLDRIPIPCSRSSRPWPPFLGSDRRSHRRICALYLWKVSTSRPRPIAVSGPKVVEGSAAGGGPGIMAAGSARVPARTPVGRPDGLSRQPSSSGTDRVAAGSQPDGAHHTNRPCSTSDEAVQRWKCRSYQQPGADLEAGRGLRETHVETSDPADRAEARSPQQQCRRGAAPSDGLARGEVALRSAGGDRWVLRLLDISGREVSAWSGRDNKPHVQDYEAITVTRLCFCVSSSTAPLP
jgi:hypothetical protein